MPKLIKRAILYGPTLIIEKLRFKKNIEHFWLFVDNVAVYFKLTKEPSLPGLKFNTVILTCTYQS